MSLPFRIALTSLLISLLPNLVLVGQTRGCIDFEDGNISPWYEFDVADISTEREPGFGNVLVLKDGPGGSIAVNNIQFGGDWVNLYGAACLCFDYKVDLHMGNGATTGVSAPSVMIYTGPPIGTHGDYVNGVRAAFIGHPGSAQIPNNEWVRSCLPIEECVDGRLPSNEFGTWRIFSGGSAITDPDIACDVWNRIIHDVTGIILRTDYHSTPSEEVFFDNFCWGCTGTIIGVKYWDRECDGVRSSNDPLLPGWEITATDPNGARFSAITDRNGFYSIAVPVGEEGTSYTMSETLQPGWKQCSPLPPNNIVHVDRDGTAIMDFGNTRIPEGQCVEFGLWEHACRYDPESGEFSLDLLSRLQSGIGCAGGVTRAEIRPVEADANRLNLTPAIFEFDSFPADIALSVNGPGIASGGTLRLDVEICCVGSEESWGDFCCRDTIEIELPRSDELGCTATITGVKYWDRECNGIRSPNEPLLPGWEITAADANGNRFTATTDGNGAYSITVPVGIEGPEYSMSERLQPGWTQCSPLPPNNIVRVGPGGTAVMDFGNSRVLEGPCTEFGEWEHVCRYDPETEERVIDLFGTLRTDMMCEDGTATISLTPVGEGWEGVEVSRTTFELTIPEREITLSLQGANAGSGGMVRLAVEICCAGAGDDSEAFCCTDTVEIPLPELDARIGIDASGPLEFCDGGAVTLSAAAPAGTFRWSTGETTRSILVTEPGDYGVEVTDMEGCRAASEMVVVRVLESPSATVQGDTVFCIGSFSELRAGGGVRYRWSPTTGLSCNDCPNPEAAPKSRTTYTVVAFNEQGCSDSARITVMPNGAADGVHAYIPRTLIAQPGTRVLVPIRLQAPGDLAMLGNADLVGGVDFNGATMRLIGVDQRGTLSEGMIYNTERSSQNGLDFRLQGRVGGETDTLLLLEMQTWLGGEATSELPLRLTLDGDMICTEMTTSPGLIRFDSICGLETRLIEFTGLERNALEPIAASHGGHAAIEFATALDGRVLMEITDVEGRAVVRPVDSHLDAGRHRLELDVSGFAAGHYFCRLTLGDWTSTRRLVIVE